MSNTAKLEAMTWKVIHATMASVLLQGRDHSLQDSDFARHCDHSSVIPSRQNNLLCFDIVFF